MKADDIQVGKTYTNVHVEAQVLSIYGAFVSYKTKKYEAQCLLSSFARWAVSEVKGE